MRRTARCRITPSDPGELLERLRLGVEVEQVVRALGLVPDLVGEPAASPEVVPDPRATRLLDQVGRALDDLLLPPFGQLGIEHEQDFVCDHVSRDLRSCGLNRPRRLASLGNRRRDDEAGSGGQCSIAAVKRPLAWLLGALAVFGFLRRRHDAAEAVTDPRADELRRKLADSRSIVEERDEFEAAELTVDLAEPAPEDPESRRRAVHDSARATVDQMRRR
jgi:hypothetical protein